MIKDLLKEGGLYTLANLLTKGVSFLLIPFYTAYFTPADYGVFDILGVFGVFVGNIFTLQLHQGLARYVADPESTENDRILYASTSFLAVLLLMILFLILAFFFSDLLIGYLSPNGLLESKTFYLSIAVIALNAIFYFLNVYLRFIRKVMLVSLFSFFNAFFGIAFLIYFVLQKDLGVNSFFLPYIIVIPVLIIVQLYVLRKKLRLAFDLKKFKMLSSYSIPLIGGGIAMVVMNLTDRIFVNDVLGEDKLGIYGIAIKFSTLITVFIAGFSTALGPIVFESHDKKSTKIELSEMFKLFIALSVGGALILSVFSAELIQNFTNEAYFGAAKVLPIMFFTAIFTGFIMFSPGLQILKKTKFITLLTVIFAVLNFVLNYYTVSRYGILGAATSTLIATMLYSLIYFFVSNHYYKFNYSKWHIILPFLYSLLSLLLINQFSNDIYLGKYIFGGISVSLYVYGAYRLNMLTAITQKLKSFF